MVIPILRVERYIIRLSKLNIVDEHYSLQFGVL